MIHTSTMQLTHNCELLALSHHVDTAQAAMHAAAKGRSLSVPNAFAYREARAKYLQALSVYEDAMFEV